MQHYKNKRDKLGIKFLIILGKDASDELRCLLLNNESNLFLVSSFNVFCNSQSI